jgi:hypothetical protein
LTVYRISLDPGLTQQWSPLFLMGEPVPTRNHRAEGPLAGLDPYDHKHLVAHLAAARRCVDIDRLPRLEGADATSAWFELRDGASELDELVADIRRAWRCSEHENPLPRVPRRVGMRSSWDRCRTSATTSRVPCWAPWSSSPSGRRATASSRVGPRAGRWSRVSPVLAGQEGVADAIFGAIADVPRWWH